MKNNEYSVYNVEAGLEKRINIDRNMLLIFEMEGVLFSSYAIDDPSCHIQRKSD